MSQPENTQLTIGEVKYHFTAGLHFDWLGFSNFITYKNTFSCLVESNPVKLETTRTVILAQQ